MATALHWIPDTLYNYSLAAVAANYNALQKETRAFHQNILFDIYYQLYKQSHLKKLSIEFSNLDIFKKLLKVKDKRLLLHNCFQAIMDHGCPIAEDLSQAFQSLCLNTCNLSTYAKKDVIQFGFSLGSFLLDAGWFPESEIVFLNCLSLCYTYNTTHIWRVILQCHTRLLCIRNFYGKFERRKTSFIEANECILKIKELGLKVNFACIYAEFSSFYFNKSDYKEAYRWSIEALNELNSCLYPREIIRVLCLASKACIFKREFKRCEMLIKQAVHMAREKFGSCNIVFASTLMDYGFYLLSMDNIEHALKAYQTALSLHTRAFGGNNLLVAKCHESLAHTLYMYEYNTGRFKDAMDHVEKALFIMTNLLGEDSFLLVSTMNLKGRRNGSIIIIISTIEHLVKKMQLVEGSNLLITSKIAHLSLLPVLLNHKRYKYPSVSGWDPINMTFLSQNDIVNPFLQNRALILEEIAVDCYDLSIKNEYFAEAQELHTYAVQFAIDEFGELNLLTAKYYANLGRLFQSMVKHKDAQRIMLKAISIKESILGPDHFEVASSANHLASLYTYDMDLHKEAEVLFLRSIEISRTLFGEGYSGLEYDYKGILRVYTKLGLTDKVFKYRTIFHNWKELRDRVTHIETDFSPLNIELEPIAPENIMSHFISVQ